MWVHMKRHVAHISGPFGLKSGCNLQENKINLLRFSYEITFNIQTSLRSSLVMCCACMCCYHNTTEKLLSSPSRSLSG